MRNKTIPSLPFSTLLNLKQKRIFLCIAAIGITFIAITDLLLSFNNEMKKLSADIASFEKSQIKKLQNYDYTEVNEDLSSFYDARPLLSIAIVDRFGITISTINTIIYDKMITKDCIYIYNDSDTVALVYHKRIVSKEGVYLGAINANIDILGLLAPLFLRLGILLSMLFMMFILLKYASERVSSSMISHLTAFTKNISEIKNSTDISIEKFNLKDTGIEELISLSNQFIELQQRSSIYDKLKQENTKLNAIASTTQILAHDVRKPFASMKSVLLMFNTLKENPSALVQARHDIEKSIKNVESMIADIMDYSREMKLETRPQALVAVLDFSIRQSAQEYKSAMISFFYELTSKKRPLVDEERLARVFMNIIGNAIEAITIIGKKPQGNIWIKSQDFESYCQITIGNDGPLINENDMAKLCESFFTKGKNKGTGLGLASAQKIVHLHGGTLKAQNRIDGSGVEFIIMIPASLENDSHSLAMLPSHLQEIYFKSHSENFSFSDSMMMKIISSGPIKILLLEDEALYRASVRNTIKSNPQLHAVVSLYEADSVEDAINVVIQEGIEWAIVDIDLGDKKNGFDFLREAKKKFPKLKAIVHSNRCIAEDKEMSKMLGAIDFVPKPLDLFNLMSLLSYHDHLLESLDFE